MAKAKKATYKDYLKQEFVGLIDVVDISDLQRRFMKNRWLDQLLWLEGRAVKSRNRHYTLRLLTVIGGVIVPALVSVNSADLNRGDRLREVFGWSAFALSQIVAVSAAVEELFGYGESYRRYRNSAESMKIEGWQFFQLTGPYTNAESHADAYPAFAANVESIIQKDVEGYVAQTAKADAKSEEATQAKIDRNIQLATAKLQEQLHEQAEQQRAMERERAAQQARESLARQTQPPAAVVADEEDEYISPDQMRGYQPGATGKPDGFALNSAFPNSAASPANTAQAAEDEDAFVSSSQLQDNSSGTASSQWKFPAISISNSTNGEKTDEPVNPEQSQGNQSEATGNQVDVNVTVTVPKAAPPPPPAPPPAPPPPPPLATPEVVADILNCSLKDTQTYLPGVLEALAEKKILDKPTLIAAIATIGVETGGFCPINEYGGPQYFTSMYEGRDDLGNTQAGDGARYHGRGFIQITGRANYREYGEKLGLGKQLEDNPELTLDPKISARILASYFYDREIDRAAQAGDWRKVRRAVNGGYNGWDEFYNFVQRALEKL